MPPHFFPVLIAMWLLCIFTCTEAIMVMVQYDCRVSGSAPIHRGMLPHWKCKILVLLKKVKLFRFPCNWKWVIVLGKLCKLGDVYYQYNWGDIKLSCVKSCSNFLSGLSQRSVCLNKAISNWWPLESKGELQVFY